MTRPNRNELCPCGSGKKNKKCCGAVANTPRSRGVLLSLAPVALLAGLGIYAAISGSGESTPAAAAPAAGGPATAPAAAQADSSPSTPAGSEQPVPRPGAAPAGKVWSPEHGHWHDAAGASGPSPIQIEVNSANPAVQADANGIRIDGKALAAAAGEIRLPGQPAGPAPEGKVWSTQHKHWHDQPTAPMETIHLGTVNRPSEPVPPPPGPAPAGMVWSPEHGHWHKAGATATPAPTATQPQ